MKNIFLVLFWLGMFGPATSRDVSAEEKKPPLQVTVSMILDGHGPAVILTVANTSDTYQIFQSISCSWQDFWQTNDKNSLLMGQQECAKNSLYTVILAPGEKHVERASPLFFHGKTGRRTIRFGYSRRVSDFTSAELKQIYNSPEKLTYFSRADIATRFRPAKETFWSAPVPVIVTQREILH